MLAPQTMNIRWAYFDSLGQCFYDPRNNGEAVFSFQIPQLDWVRVRLAVTKGRARVSSAGVPLAQYRVNLSDYTSSLLAFKTNSQLLAGASGALAFTNGGGFDPADTDWHSAALGCVTLAPVVCPITLNCQWYNSDLVLLKANDRWTLRDGNAAPWRIERVVFTGLESNAPEGLPGGLSGTWEITGTNSHVDLSIPNATENAQLAIGVLPSTGDAGDPGTITQEPLAGGADTVRLSVGSAPGTGASFRGTYTLLRL